MNLLERKLEIEGDLKLGNKKWLISYVEFMYIIVVWLRMDMKEGGEECDCVNPIVNIPWFDLNLQFIF
ncbi:hypothetical protein L6452_04878 [Arctium lappa]|uniref:Uncharacterized protein n=1 Tax=Arctium lappa TaxID=4217 RepID=A0ACB9EEU6_ARCLA|nr:hypothetical protein L6452_04878 [Arctium lappa]